MNIPDTIVVVLECVWRVCVCVCVRVWCWSVCVVRSVPECKSRTKPLEATQPKPRVFCDL